MTAPFAQATTAHHRRITRVIQGAPVSDGAGVRLRRSIGLQPGARLDPFLMLDEFYAEQAADYLAGFPAHPHRGFETVTYMLDGLMAHEDHMGNQGLLSPGSVQWMTAGRGIIHSEMPRQQSGRMRGFQLWLNLPARLKMRAPWYRDLAPDAIPMHALPDGGSLKLIAGSGRATDPALRGAIGGLIEADRWCDHTDPIYWDLRLPPSGVFEEGLKESHQAFVYAYEGGGRVGPADAATPLPTRAVAVLGAGDRLRVEAGEHGLHCLVIAGRPIGEPVAQYGPFVMNTREELEQAVIDYQNGRLALPA